MLLGNNSQKIGREQSYVIVRAKLRLAASYCNRVPRILLLCTICSLALVITVFCHEETISDDKTAKSQRAQPTSGASSGADGNSGKLINFDDEQTIEFDDNENQDAPIEDEEDYLEEEEFYNQHPVELATNQRELANDIQVRDSDFDDEQETSKTKRRRLYTNSSGGSRRSKFSRQKRRPRGKTEQRAMNSTSDSSGGIAQSSQHSGTTRTGGPLAAGCALMLLRGDCITFESLEWTIRRAKSLVDYQRPGDLDSLEPSESSIGAVGQLNEMISRLLAARFSLAPEEIARELEDIDVRQTSLWRECPRPFRSAPVCTSLSRYRSHSGRCNNLLGPHLGSSNMPFVRMQPPDYGDGVGFARRSSASGNQLPPARLLAITLHSELESPSSDLSALFMAWGQLINHDLAQASTAREATGHEEKCCSRALIRQQLRGRMDSYLSNCMPILMAPDDPVYGPVGVGCHEFKRSLAGLRPTCSLGPRTQINTITSYVDASFVYGSSSGMSASLRGTQRGHLATWNYFERHRLKPLLPAQVESPDEECIGRRGGRFCFRSGDSRTNQHIQLVVLHTIHTRQHNRLASGLAALNPHWSGQRIYHEARHIHIALVQHILLSEYLPELLGPKMCAKYQLEETAGWWQGYDPTVSAGISQEFAAAAFRQGHTSVAGQVFRFDPVSHEPVRSYSLRQLFRQPWALYEPGAVDEFTVGMVEAPAKSRDPSMSAELNGHLLEVPGERVGLDLASMNIQRGRDQGVASYNSFRDWCGLSRVDSFEELQELMSNRSSFMMGQLYESVDDIDLFTGGASEFPLEGAQVGPTFACIIGRQFELLRAGDRFWFENGPQSGPQAFTPEQLASIKQVTLARLLCSNSDSQFDVQAQAFRLPHPILNPRQPCAALPDLELALWFEPAARDDELTGDGDGADSDSDNDADYLDDW